MWENVLSSDGITSHVCAVSLSNGSTALHRAIEHGDDYQAAKLLLTADSTCLNLQNDAGLTPLHLACKLGRKKVIELLLVGIKLYFFKAVIQSNLFLMLVLTFICKIQYSYIRSILKCSLSAIQFKFVRFFNVKLLSFVNNVLSLIYLFFILWKCSFMFFLFSSSIYRLQKALTLMHVLLIVSYQRRPPQINPLYVWFRMHASTSQECEYKLPAIFAHMHLVEKKIKGKRRNRQNLQSILWRVC